MAGRSELRVALVGAGRMGRSHLLAARELGLGVAALCDRSDEHLTRIGDEFAVPSSHRYREAADLFAREAALDLVIVATTADFHLDCVLQAAGAGVRMILCEKPMATSVADCDAMIAACRASGSRLAINHQMRFMDQYTLIRDELRNGRFGALASMNVVAGCFGLAMNGSHYFEAFAYLTGQPVEAVSAWLQGDGIGNPRGPQFRDQAGELRALGRGGQRLTMAAGMDQGHGMTVTYATAFGHIFVDELEGIYYATARRPEHRDQPSTRFGMPWERWQVTFPQADNVRATRALLDALLAGADHPTGEDGRHAVAALVAANRSAEDGGRAVRLSELGADLDRRFLWA